MGESERENNCLAKPQTARQFRVCGSSPGIMNPRISDQEGTSGTAESCSDSEKEGFAVRLSPDNNRAETTWLQTIGVENRPPSQHLLTLLQGPTISAFVGWDADIWEGTDGLLQCTSDTLLVLFKQPLRKML